MAQIFIKHNFKILFVILSCCLLAVTMFRYGLGTDYFSYQYHYYLIPSNISSAFEFDSHMDIGFRVLMSMFRSVSLKFYIFTAFLGALTLILYLVTIKKNSKVPIFSLFLLYSLYWLVYVNSALRQGLAMALFIFAFYQFVNTKNTVKYIFIILLASLFHKTALIGLVVLVVYRFYRRLFNNKRFNLLLVFMALFLFLIKGDIIVINLMSLIGISISYQSSQANIMAIMLRGGNIVLMYLIYRSLHHRDKNESIKFQLYLYFISVLIFIATSNTPTLSRAIDFLMIIEIILFPNLLSYVRLRFDNLILVGILVMISSILFVKDMGADLIQAKYYNKDILDYPYITFYERDKILNFRPIMTGKID